MVELNLLSKSISNAMNTSPTRANCGGKLMFIVPVWGDFYIDIFLTATLPCLLTDGNFLSLRRDEGQFRIVTSWAD
jgi:hypothetical protein